MRLSNKYLVVALCLFTGSSGLAAADVTDIENYREYSPLFSSSGQPSAKQLKTVADAGFKRVIYIAFSDNKTAIDAEDRVVKSLGMDYVHIPVDWDQPTLEGVSNSIRKTSPVSMKQPSPPSNLPTPAFLKLPRVADSEE